MKQLLIKDGGVAVEEVPAPAPQPGCILVRTAHSCISSGTELGVLRQRATPLWRKALEKPEQIKKALDMVQRDGLRKTWSAIEQKVNAPLPLGYSAAGEVIAVGEGVQEFSVGELVACAGAQCAFHAEILCVPVNLAVKLPQRLGTAEASTVALGAIALQGVRRLNPTLGETFVVFGLGLLGQLSVQLLKANGCRVIGLDLDPSRVQTALDLGADEALAGDEKLAATVLALTEGVGADGVLITASGSSETLLAQAFRSCRKKGRVVLVGDVPLDIKRADIYEKELDFLVSCSYGPGRYDRQFEEQGLDYPLPYVRWTETRNMHAYLQLLAEKRLKLESLLKERFPIQEASSAFAKISASGAMTALLEYPAAGHLPARSVQIAAPAPVRGEKLRLAVVGAGNFTRAMHAPILKSFQKEISVRTVVARQGHSAKAAADLLGAQIASTDLNEMLADTQIDAVLVATRHNLHASFALQCLRAGKHVFLEKPTALDREGLTALEAQVKANPKGPLLFTGFNRRFSPAAREIRSALSQRQTPLMIQYTMNAGFLPKEHWVHGAEGGGRNLGEACHIYDLFLYWTGSKAITSVKAEGIAPAGPYLRNDNFSATMRFNDGSVAQLLYTAMGNTGVPKECAQIFSGGTILQLDDFKEVRTFGAAGGTPKISTHKSKGHEEEWRAFLDLLRGKSELEYDAFDQFLATEISFQVEDALRG
jgi:predicted dehydrogenase/threonine dehydrogenase-like Zn-dependent dehydrogenase